MDRFDFPELRPSLDARAKLVLDGRSYAVSDLIPESHPDDVWFEVAPPVQELIPNAKFYSYGHIYGGKSAWKAAVTPPAATFGRVLEAHGVEGYKFPFCPLCPDSGWGYARHLPAEMHYKKVYKYASEANEPIDELRERFWQTIIVVGGRIRFNHIDAAIQVLRAPEHPQVHPMLQTVADIELEGVWARVRGRCSTAIYAEGTREDYPPLMCGRTAFKDCIKGSVDIFREILRRHGVQSVDCSLCASRHELSADYIGGKNHYNMLWEKSRRDGLDSEQYWDIYTVQVSGMRGLIRFNHLNGAIDLLRTGLASASAPLRLTPPPPPPPHHGPIPQGSLQAVERHLAALRQVSASTLVPSSVPVAPCGAHFASSDDLNACATTLPNTNREKGSTNPAAHAGAHARIQSPTSRKRFAVSCALGAPCEAVQEETIADFDGSIYGPDYLSFGVGVRVLKRYLEDEWAFGEILPTGRQGWYPPHYARPVGTSCAGSSSFDAALEQGRAGDAGSLLRTCEGQTPAVHDETITTFDGSRFGLGYLSFDIGVSVQRLYVEDEWAFGQILTTGEKGWYPSDSTTPGVEFTIEL